MGTGHEWGSNPLASQDQASLTAQQEPHSYALMKSTECKKISSGSDEGGGEGHIGGTCKEVSNVVSSSEV